MSVVSNKIADALDKIRKLQEGGEIVIIRDTSILTAEEMLLLSGSGWLKEIIKGWYIPSQPGLEGDTTMWFASYWHFVSSYLNEKYEDDWCLSAEQSLDFYAGKTVVPQQLIVRSSKGSNNIVNLAFGTTLLCIKAVMPQQVYVHPSLKIHLYTLEEALLLAAPSYYRLDPISARICLAQFSDSQSLMKLLLREKSVRRTNRLVGAFQNIGRSDVATMITSVMKAEGMDVRRDDPFEQPSSLDMSFTTSPYVYRIQLMWNAMKDKVMELVPEVPLRTIEIESCLTRIDERYKEDAYHSLSIEGYRVTRELIERVRQGEWNPDAEDKDRRNALVARGYYLAFESVKRTIRTIFAGKDAGEAVMADHTDWYLQMWSPFVEAGLMQSYQLAGYRSSQVYIQGSMHTPLSPEAVRLVMPVLFRLIIDEKNVMVRAILGHFFFGYIHPYLDGNGRMSRFLLNVMLVSGGYDWIVIPVDRRNEYMAALEKASVQADITDFTLFIRSLL